MTITLHAVTTATFDADAIRADGWQAGITEAQCGEIATILEAAGICAYPARDEDNLRFYGHYVPAFGIDEVDASIQASILAILEGNEAARDIVHKVMVNHIQVRFGRNLVDNGYTVSLSCEASDTVDVNLCAGNWNRFRNLLGLGGAEDGDSEIGSLQVDDIEKALQGPKAVYVLFGDDYTRSVVERLSGLLDYARRKGATEIAWA